MNILANIRKAARLDAAGIAHAATEARTALAAAQGREREANTARRAAIIAGDEKALATAETALVTARLEVERLMIASEELERRAGEAEAAEARAGLDRERAEVERRAAAVASKLRKDYSEAGSRIVALLTELREAEEAVKAVNARLAAAGRDDTLQAVEPRTIDPGRNSEVVAGLAVLTSLRPLAGCEGWGHGRAAAANLGLPS